MISRRALVGLILLATLAGVVLGCREDVPPLFRRNRAPKTTLTIIAEESTTAFYRYHVYWRGEDADGEVIRYLFAITDTLSNDELAKMMMEKRDISEPEQLEDYLFKILKS